MKTSLRTILTAVMMVSLIGCSRDSNAGGYTVSYEIKSSPTGGNPLYVTVAGPAAKLAVLFGPENQVPPALVIISKDEMLANSYTVWFTPSTGEWQDGRFTLTVKDAESEKIVFQRTILLSAGKLAITNLKPTFSPKEPGKPDLVMDSVAITVEKEGDLPIQIVGVIVNINGKRCIKDQIKAGQSMKNHKCTVDVDVVVPEKNGKEIAVFHPGEQFTMSVALIYGLAHDKHVYVNDMQLTVPDESAAKL